MTGKCPIKLSARQQYRVCVLGKRQDLTDAFTVILQYAPKDMLAGCTVDESFLMWFYAQYGRDAVIHIAFDVLDGGNDPDVWYEETGNSIHVLWLLYCRDSGFGQRILDADSGCLGNGIWIRR